MAKRSEQVKDVRFRADASGCLSRPAFEGAVTAALKREPLATLVHLDLDDLLVLNEKAGREAGDRAINASIATLSKTAAKEGWTLGRIGGDEFALLAPGTSLEPVFLRAEQLRKELDAALEKAIPHGQKCTVSMGVANTPRDTKSRGPAAGDELMRKADLALLAAKEQGGDAVGLTPSDDMVLKSSYYSAAQLGRLKGLAERQKKKEAALLREALDDLLRKHERS
ncbi:MAG: GGDEF domain-containing protein [Chloroflexi bacterium]|nr:MAG: GGDEF domain-containing protein [Chloroflexota bacterium]TMF54789.1 MAG: GGDEF domain-containing protein [Chloroflexota bacterium]